MSDRKKLDLPIRYCIFCGTEYKPKRIKQLFCSSHCRWNAWSKDNPRKTVYIKQGVK